MIKSSGKRKAQPPPLPEETERIIASKERPHGAPTSIETSKRSILCVAGTKPVIVDEDALADFLFFGTAPEVTKLEVKPNKKETTEYEKLRVKTRHHGS